MTNSVLAEHEELKRREEALLNLLAEATDSRDYDTAGHIRRITEMVRILVDEMVDSRKAGYSLSDAEAEAITKTAKLHDIGKIAVPDSILLKPGTLSEMEFDIVMVHPAYGANLLEKYIKPSDESLFFVTAKDIVLHHHEKWNGSGYPSGLKGDDIPLSGRIVAVADVYDALTSPRPYKKAFSHEKAVVIICEDSGVQFDPYLVSLFKKNEKAFEKISQKR